MIGHDVLGVKSKAKEGVSILLKAWAEFYIGMWI